MTGTVGASAAEHTGYNFELSADQRAFRDHLRSFVDARLPKQLCHDLEAQEEFPRELWQTLAAADLHGVGIPEEYGGQGGGVVEQMIVARELTRTLSGLVWIWAGTSFAGSKAIAHFGTDEQKARFLPDIAAGRMQFSIALTEPDGGTDVFGAMRTRAVAADGGWRITGTKIWSTMAHVADMILVIARTEASPEKPSRGLSIFLCDANAPGVTAKPIPKLGMRSMGSCEVQFEEVFVPDENLLGEVGGGWHLLSQTLNNERILVAAMCVGTLEGILDDMISYASERKAFGKPLGQFQAVQHMIANAKMGLDAAELLMMKAAWLQAQDQPCGVESTTAKVFASEAAFKAADDGIQILGGYGYALEYDMQRYWRESRLYRIAPINNEMGRNFVGESLGLPRSF
jgi:acyl-CoA dehydrogenase